MKGFRYLSDVTTLSFNASACVGCRRCLEVCPHQVFDTVRGKVALSDRDACMECGACARNCPAGALAVDAGVGCASGLINEWFRERKLPGFSKGTCS